jgi:hypothetical protein
MANPNPYKNYEVNILVENAFKEGNFDYIRERMQFLLHRSRKFEDCYNREYQRNLKLRKILESHGIEYDLKLYKEKDPYK